MNDRGKDQVTPETLAARIGQLTVALENTERKLVAREALLTTALSQTEAARAQYSQATERAEALNRRLEAKEQQLNALQAVLQQRDARIATLEQLSAEDDNVLNALNDDIKRSNSASPKDSFTAMGLVMKSLDHPNLIFKIAGPITTIGRAATNDMTINSQSVSRYHARLVIDTGGIFLIDLQSTNGCKINGRAITRHLISDGDTISIGHATFKFSIGESSQMSDAMEMDETHTMLDDAVVLVPVPKSKPHTTQ